MPKPPVLEQIDWKVQFESGLDYERWIEQGESPENRQKMQDAADSLEIEASIEQFLQGLPKTVHVVAIAEDWCGDVVRHVPALMRMARETPRLQVRFRSREDDKQVFARFLTNGGEAIPKFVFLSEDFVECGNWGPMPHACRLLIARGKACNDVGGARKLVGEAYEADKGLQIVIHELAELADIASSTSPDPADSRLTRILHP
jgi:hypothetical protein